MKLLEGKKALITGGGRGIGKAVAIEFAKNGADIAIVSRTESELNQTQKEIENYGVRCITIPIDLSSIDAVKDCVNQYFNNFEQCDILICNAGMTHFSTVIDYPLEKAEKLFNLNFISYYALIKLILPKMIKQGEGNIILTSSPQGTVYFSSHKVAYSASKAAVMAMGKCLQLEVGRQNIRVNIISPGAIHTKMMEDLIEWGQNFPEKVPPEEIAPLYLFFASEVSKRKYKGQVINHLMLNEILRNIKENFGDNEFEIKEIVNLMEDKLNKEYFTFLRKNQELFEFMLKYTL
ncbi:MAG: SDR family oxidoreductase [Promethearchaeota archaeon]|nr:MAG: SDR family oxidoreductase [Candidatus Lokiarchaeota archaeon]